MLPSFLTGPVAGAGVALAIVAGGVAWAKLSYEPAIRAEYAAEIAALTAAQQAADQDAAIRAVEASSMAAVARAADRAIIRERIIRVPVTTACAASPAVGVALDGLRPRAAGSGAPVRAGGAADVPGPADPALGSVR